MLYRHRLNNKSLLLFFWFSCILALALLSGNVYSKAETSVFKTIDAARVAIDRSKMNDSQRQAALEYLEAARADEREVQTLKERLIELRAETADHPKRMDQLQKALATNHEQELREWSKRLPTNADGETLEQILERERTIIADLRAQIQSTSEDLVLALSRPAQAEEQIATLHRRIEELSVPLVVSKDEPAALHEARSLRRSSEQRRLQALLELRLAEQDTATQRQSQNELVLHELRYRTGLHEKRVELLQQRINSRGRRELEVLNEQLLQQQQELAQSGAVFASAAKTNRAIGEELIRHNELLARDRKALTVNEQDRERIAVNLQDSRTRLDVGSANERVGRWLWGERRRLKPVAHFQQRLKLIRNDLAELRLERIVLNEQQRELLDIDKAAQALIDARFDTLNERQVEESAKKQLLPLLQKRVELLFLLESMLQRRIATLERSEQAMQEQIQFSQELQQLLDRRLLWIPGHGFIDGGWWQRMPDGLQDLVKFSRFITLGELALQNFSQQPVPWLISLLFMLILLQLRYRARTRIEGLAMETYQIRKDSYQMTVKTFGWTFLAALPAPLIIALTGQLLQQAGSPGRFSHSFGQACLLMVLPLLAVQFLRWASIERGLGHAHFRWTKQRRTALRHWLPIAMSVLPLYFISSLAFIRKHDLAVDVQARLAIVLSCVILAWVLWRLLDVGRLWVIRGVASEPSLLRKALRVALPAMLLAVAGLALAGYVFSAGMILQSMLASFIVIVAVAIAMGMLGRWFLLGERRLALRRLEEHRRAEAQAAGESGEVMLEPDENITLEQVNTQTQRLLRALRLSLLAVGLIAVWVTILPAMTRLDEIVLWHVSDTGADGATTQQPVTLMIVLLGIFTLALTTAAARNLPGLIEISLLSHIRIDTASRYAITSVLRYAIVIGGTLVGLGLLGMRWSQLQWMAAALSVGLGFGLQEIFANFVSGIILLFERPFRVGDVITVGGFSGRVTKIRTRATTVLDFDNKEIVIPNKTFITGQLTNWTLTDTITRIVIKVGVAYGTDADTVRALLLQAAKKDQRVLAEPEPSCWFVAFGKESLEFELRVYVSTVGERMEVQNALNTQITMLFAEHGIEMGAVANN
ncbi:mechanosensitive ion channel domain-containing protein [Nitrosomonas sp.]|uniref:mechanosensitive ion channel domain-containing protein n=1 Tax=Nitrosomonas sp. TaxID=42353 RepID=UPI0025E81E75|nr:mechanosensitive ion channel domain-containing protein [Nitrosomonas sp.]MBV6447390.1 Mechanosensitive channel MscK [Nitrosomonas sp.]